MTEGAEHNPGDRRKELADDIAANDAAFSNNPARQRASISEQAFIDRIKSSDRWMIGLTGLIAAGGLISSIIFGFQLHEMQTAGHLTQESIRISEESLKVGRDTFIAGQRPWVSIKMSIFGPLIFDKSGAEIKIGVRLKNHGHSPALNVRDFVILDPAVSGQKGHLFCEAQRKRSGSNFARVIFPDDAVSEILTAFANTNEIKNATLRNGTIAPTITACVDLPLGSTIFGIKQR